MDQRGLYWTVYFPALIIMYGTIQLIMQQRRVQLRRTIMQRRRQRMERIYSHIQATYTAASLLLLNCSHLHGENYFVNAIRHNRRTWMKVRSQDFWKRIVGEHFTDEDFMETFRIKKKSLHKLCHQLASYLEPKHVQLKSREPLSVEKQVAVALYKLASCGEYRVVGNVFGIHKSTVKKCVYRVVTAINESMLRKYIYMPRETEAREIASRFENIAKIPQIIGCPDGSHIPILPPSDRFRDYVNRKGWPSYNMQAVVDDKCRFRDIFVKYPGNTHDAAVLKASSLYNNVENIIPQRPRFFHGENIPFMILGDPAYPLLPWLMKGYSGAVTAEEESFNVYLNSARVVVEMAFGRLKGRWRILLKRMDIHYTFAPQIISACCVLYNFMEECKDPFLSRWLHDVDAAEQTFPQPAHQRHRGRDDITGTNIRTHLSNYLVANFPLRTSFNI